MAQDDGTVESEGADYATAVASAARQALAGVIGPRAGAGDTVVLALGKKNGQWQDPPAEVLAKLAERSYKVLPASAGRYNAGSGANPPSWNLRQGNAPVIFLGLELTPVAGANPPQYRVTMNGFNTSQAMAEGLLTRDGARWKLTRE